MSRWLISVMLVLFPLIASAAAELQPPSSLVAAPESVQGEFLQEKYIQALDARFESSGVFFYRRGESIRWQTLSPVESLMVMTPTTITTIQNGIELSQLDSTQNPVVKVFSDIFFGVMTAEWELLSAYFQLQDVEDGEHWKVSLLPIDSNIGQAVSRVELRGGQYLREAILFEPTGDQTIIRFVAYQQ